MALMINADCVNCAACEPECPNSAISAGDPVYVIDSDKCTECVGYFAESQCIDACPVECIIPNPERVETKEQLQRKFEQLLTAES
ncbi:MAG TPA: YfhL family 4Fe-4S dicluster ferredoxin [Burkholderiaceae bacterium]|nr:YfhL family 4Fe-4S dicluster ferredoxin [Burkholderiaceae bacterium]